MTIEEMKVRQLANQHLLQSTDKMTVLHDLCGVQAQFMANTMHSLKIRCSDYDENTIKNGLVKNWTIRGTVHVFAEDDLPLFMHCNNRLEALARIAELYEALDAHVISDDLSIDEMRGAMILLEQLRGYIEQRKKVLRSHTLT